MPIISILLSSVLFLVACVPIKEPEPLRYVPSKDLKIPAPAELSNYIYGIVDCRDAEGLLKANLPDAEELLGRSLQTLRFSDVNCYTLSSFKMDNFYKEMTRVIETDDYELQDALSIYPTGTEIVIEFWKSGEKTKGLVYSGTGDFIVMDVSESR